jgi:hypothetical protein
MIGKRMVLAMVLACGVRAAFPAIGSALIPSGDLIVHRSELRGFATATRIVHSTQSPHVYATIINRDGPAEAKTEIAQLKGEGFREGVQELLLATPQGEAVSDALVFGSSRGARLEFKANLSEDLKAHPGLKRFSVGIIPGSVGLSQFESGGAGATTDVLFSTGRCFFLVGTAVYGVLTKRQAIADANAAAHALYRRTRSVCERPVIS